MRVRAIATIAIALMLVVTACGDDDAGDDHATDDHLHATGTVTAVDGNLTSVSSFTIRTEDGTDLTFTPEEGILFDGTAPISHLQDHLTSGSPVTISYEAAADGTLIATAVGDADDGDHDHED